MFVELMQEAVRTSDAMFALIDAGRDDGDVYAALFSFKDRVDRANLDGFIDEMEAVDLMIRVGF